MKLRKITFLGIATIAVSTAYAAQPVPCAQLGKLKLDQVTHIEAMSVPAGPFTPPGAKEPLAGGALPSFCRVQLTVAPAINIEVWLPEKGWNERYRSEGNGGYAGAISYGPMAESLRAGFATASTDTGHKSTEGGSFAFNPDGSLNWQLIEDFAYRSLHQLALKAKAVTAAYYGMRPRYSYWVGCSTGGRQALMAVQRFPEEYDGILAGCPAIAWDRFMPTLIWPQVVMRERLGRPLAAEKRRLVTDAAIKACDSQDGVTDQLVSDPRSCRFDPAALACAANKDQLNCLTDKEVDTVRTLWRGPHSKTGERLWFMPEKTAPPWLWGIEPTDQNVEHLKWVMEDRKADWTKITEKNFEAYYIDQSVRKFRHVIGTDDPHIKRFLQGKGKLLMWQGEHDWIYSARDSTNYYSRVVKAVGDSFAIDKSIRYFLLPGVGHCGVDNPELTPSVAPFPADPLAEGVPSSDHLFNALVAWVEKGEAPERIIASQKLDNGSIRTRPLCPFPKVARWNGKGSSDDAANFSCVNSTSDPDDFKTKYD